MAPAPITSVFASVQNDQELTFSDIVRGTTSDETKKRRANRASSATWAEQLTAKGQSWIPDRGNNNAPSENAVT